MSTGHPAVVRRQTDEIFLHSKLKVPDQISEEHECAFEYTDDNNRGVRFILEERSVVGVNFVCDGLDSLADGLGVIQNGKLEIFVCDNFVVCGHALMRFCFGDYN
jgi:hypothetical protein